MPRSPAGPGRPFCASDRGTPDAKHVKIDASVSGFPAMARAARGAAKGAPVNSATASSSIWPRRPAAAARKERETRRVTSVAPLSGSDAGETRPSFEVDQAYRARGKAGRKQIPTFDDQRGAPDSRAAACGAWLSAPLWHGAVPHHETVIRVQTFQRRQRQCAVSTTWPSLRAHDFLPIAAYAACLFAGSGAC